MSIAVTHAPSAPDLTDSEFPKYYVWTPNKKQWVRRSRPPVSDSVTRIYSVRPSAKKFYLRVLLNHEGATSFNYLKTVDGIQHTTYNIQRSVYDVFTTSRRF